VDLRERRADNERRLRQVSFARAVTGVRHVRGRALPSRSTDSHDASVPRNQVQLMRKHSHSSFVVNGDSPANCELTDARLADQPSPPTEQAMAASAAMPRQRHQPARHRVLHVYVDESARFTPSSVAAVRACLRTTGRHVRRSRPSCGPRRGSRRGATRSASRGDPPGSTDPDDGDSDDEHRVAALAGRPA